MMITRENPNRAALRVGALRYSAAGVCLLARELNQAVRRRAKQYVERAEASVVGALSLR